MNPNHSLAVDRPIGLGPTSYRRPKKDWYFIIFNNLQGAYYAQGTVLNTIHAFAHSIPRTTHEQGTNIILTTDEKPET